jgi:two-component system, OmpR family, sensor histidine kinase BaeS
MRWLRASLARKLFVSYLLVIAAGGTTLFTVTQIVVSTSLAAHITEEMHEQRVARGHPLAHTAASTAPVEAAAREAAQEREEMLEVFMAGAATALVAAVLLSLVISRQITQPVRRMLRATQRIATGHYAERVPVTPAMAHDEFGQLAASFNAMAATLEQTEQRRRALVADVAHELRTPIATLEGYLEGLLDGVVAPTARIWAKLYDEAGHLRRLVDDLQELSRAEARQIPVVLQPVPPAALIQAALDRLAPQFAEKGLELSIAAASQLPPVLADEDRAVQVLTNLLTNALRYTPAPGRVEVVAERQGDAVAIHVVDTGVGLAPEHLEHVFERFYRVDPSRSRAVGGVGIGLTIAKALTEAMGGEIVGASAGLGRGSTFTVRWPVAPSSVPDGPGPLLLSGS